MSIILNDTQRIKTIESINESDIDTTATELLGLWEFVVESYELDEVKKESIFHCRIQLDYAICPRCRCVSEDIHQYKRRRVRDMMCFEYTVKPVAVSGCTIQAFPEFSKYGTFDVEDFASAYVRFENGATMAIEVSWAQNCSSEKQFSEIYGTKAGASISPLVIWTEQNGVLTDIEPKSPKGLSQFEHFADCILNKKTPISSAQDGVTMMKILDAIYASSETKREVVINWD